MLARLARSLELRLAIADAPAALAALDPYEPAGAAVPASLVRAPMITRRDLPQMSAIDATVD